MTDLESVLGRVSETIEWPEPSPHLVSRVMARVEAHRAPSTSRHWVLGAVALLVMTLVALPGPRQAVADLFEEAGVLIGLVDEDPADPGRGLDLGERVSMELAVATAGFVPRTPLGELGPPDALYLDSGGTVSMVWKGSDALPADADTGIAILLTQSEGEARRAVKGVGPSTLVEIVPVDGGAGLWIEGAPHAFTLTDSDGNPSEETTRLAANVLLWEAGGLDYRLELTGDLNQAITVAESLEE